jgi:hypothetical protein
MREKHNGITTGTPFNNKNREAPHSAFCSSFFGSSSSYKKFTTEYQHASEEEIPTKPRPRSIEPQ